MTTNALTATKSRNHEAQPEIPNALSNGLRCEHGPKKLVVVLVASYQVLIHKNVRIKMYVQTCLNLAHISETVQPLSTGKATPIMRIGKVIRTYTRLGFHSFTLVCFNPTHESRW